jgi:predicted SnoaL-like aldol condensation-catalyzing enzyme
MDKKKIAQSFLESAGLGAVEKAFEAYVAPNFIHHNQYFKGDRLSLKEAMEEDHKKNPNESITIKKSYIDGETVITHSLVVKKKMQIAVVHIFRFKGDKIVELWDIGQIAEEDSPNQNGLF